MGTSPQIDSSDGMPSWAQLAQKYPVDPYAVWCIKTKFRTLKVRGNLPGTLNFIVELARPSHPKESASAPTSPAERPTDQPSHPVGSSRWIPSKLAGHAVSNIAPAYDNLLGGRRASFVTVRIECKELDDEQWGQEQERAIKTLISDTDVLRVQLGYPLEQRNSPAHRAGGEVPVAEQAEMPSVVLGVLEDGGPFAHPALCQAVGAKVVSRVQAIWDQTSWRSGAGRWGAAHQFPYGQQLTKKDMDTVLEQHRNEQRVDEEAVYSDRLIAMPRLALRTSHGAAVLSLLCGTRSLLPRWPGQQDTDDDLESIESEPEPASTAPIVLVHLPLQQTVVHSGRWFAVNALDGLRYIIEQTCRMSPSPRKRLPPLVVNVSYGAIAGPHDGTGMLESAIDELTDLYAEVSSGMAVVLAAGNTNGGSSVADGEEGDEGEACHVASGIHAKAVIPPGDSKIFALFVPPDKRFETYVEIWFDEIFDPGSNQQKVKIVVTPPDGEPWRPVSCNDTLFWPEEKNIEAGLLFYPKVPQGKNGSMALLVLAATRISDRGFESAPAGLWQIEVTSCMGAESNPKDMIVEAWVERDDTETGLRRPQSAHFVTMDNGKAVPPTDENTFTSIATGHKTFVAGSLMDCGGGETKVSPYSATAGSKERGPHFSAVTDDGYALRGIRVSGNRSGLVTRANGTSMAAPQAARWIANKLAKGKTLDEIRGYLDRLTPDARKGRLTVPVPPAQDTQP